MRLSPVRNREKGEKPKKRRIDPDAAFSKPFDYLSRPNFLLKRLTRPPVSTIFCLPVKKG